MIESLDELEKLCVDLFSGVENRNAQGPEWKEHPFGEKQLRMKGFVVPVKDIRNLNITFPMPDMRQHYESQVLFRFFFSPSYHNLKIDTSIIMYQFISDGFNSEMFHFAAGALCEPLDRTRRTRQFAL